MVHDSRLWMYEGTLWRKQVTTPWCDLQVVLLICDFSKGRTLVKTKVQMRLCPDVAELEERRRVTCHTGGKPACSFLIRSRSGARNASKFQTDRHVKLSHNSFPTAELHRVVGVLPPSTRSISSDCLRWADLDLSMEGFSQG